MITRGRVGGLLAPSPTAHGRDWDGGAANGREGRGKKSKRWGVATIVATRLMLPQKPPAAAPAASPCRTCPRSMMWNRTPSEEPWVMIFSPLR